MQPGDASRIGKWLTRESMSLTTVIAILAVDVLAFVLLYRWLGPRVAVLAAPLFAIVAAPPLINLMPAYWRWVKERSLGKWQGRYYAFDDQQVRVAEARGRLWFSCADVHTALGMERRPATLTPLTTSERMTHEELGEALTAAGIARMFGRHTDLRVLRLVHWAERDVERQWLRSRERDASTSA